MASSGLRRMASTKQQPREFDSTLINPKNSNSTWLQQNLQEMEQHIKKLVKFMEDNMNSIGKKTRPESISLVQKCHHMYLSLADRYIKETRGNVSSQVSSISKAIVGSGSKQLKRVLSSKACSDTRDLDDPSADDDYSDTESDVDGQELDENDIAEMEFAPLNHETTIEEEDKTEESDLEFKGLKLNSLSDNSNNDVSAEENLDETEDLSLEEEQVMAWDKEIEKLKLSIYKAEIENTIRMLEKQLNELNEMLQHMTKKYHAIEEDHNQLIRRRNELQGVISSKVRKINQMKIKLKMVVETERRMRFGILIVISVAAIIFGIFFVKYDCQLSANSMA